MNFLLIKEVRFKRTFHLSRDFNLAYADERQRLWAIAVEAFSYKEKTERVIPVFVAEPR